MPLERFRLAKASELAALKKAADAGCLPAPLQEKRPDFAAALNRRPKIGPLAVVAEYKRASPSKGVICETLSVEQVARQYAEAGACAMSVLTEESWFQGDLAFLSRAAQALERAGLPKLPLLRKDFIFDPLQVIATAATPAAALLLIVRLAPKASELRSLRETAEANGMAAVVEVFDARDLALARESGARIIQVNARDLESLKVDCEAPLSLIRACPPLAGELWIAASGMDSFSHLARAADAGYAAALVGTALMAAGKPGEALARLLKGNGAEASGD